MLPKRVKFNEDIGDTCTPHNQRTFTLSTTVASWTHPIVNWHADCGHRSYNPSRTHEQPHVLADTLVETLEVCTRALLLTGSPTPTT